MEVKDNKHEHPVAYAMGRIFGGIVITALFLLTMLLIGGLGYKLVCWIFGL